MLVIRQKGLATSAPEVVLQQLLWTGGPSESVLTIIKYLAEKHLLKCTRGRKWKLKQIQRTIWHSYQMICLSKNFICDKNKHLGNLYDKCSLWQVTKNETNFRTNLLIFWMHIFNEIFDRFICLITFARTKHHFFAENLCWPSLERMHMCIRSLKYSLKSSAYPTSSLFGTSNPM